MLKSRMDFVDAPRLVRGCIERQTVIFLTLFGAHRWGLDLGLVFFTLPALAS